MGGIFDTAGAHKLFILVREDVIHLVATHKSCGTQRYVQLITSLIIIPESLASALGHGYSHERGHLWRVEIVQRGINVPTVEACVSEIIDFRDRVLVKFPVMRMHELDVLQAFVLRDQTITNDLDFWLVWNGLKIWVENAAFGVKGFAVSIALSVGIESVGKLILSFGRAARLTLKYYDLGPVEGLTDVGKVIICRMLSVLSRREYCGSHILTQEVTVPRSAPIQGNYLSHAEFRAAHSPVKFSTFTLFMIAPKSGSKDGIDTALMDEESERMPMIVLSVEDYIRVNEDYLWELFREALCRSF